MLPPPKTEIDYSSFELEKPLSEPHLGFRISDWLLDYISEVIPSFFCTKTLGDFGDVGGWLRTRDLNRHRDLI